MPVGIAPTALLAATGADVASAFVEIGLIGLGLALLSGIAARLGITAVPFYLLVGLMFGRGGLAEIGLSEEFVSLGAEIGVLLLLLVLGLEYTTAELNSGLRSGLVPGLLDAALNFTPGFLIGLILSWSLPGAALLGGVSWVSSSGVISKVLSDLDRLGNRETPAVLNLLVIEDLAMAVYLPVVAAVVAGEALGETAVTVAVALAMVAGVLVAATLLGPTLSRRLDRATNESLLLTVFGLTLVVGGLAQRFQISAAIGAFLVGLAVSGPVQSRVQTLIEPLRDLFAAMFFFFFASQIDPADLPGAFVPAAALFVLSGLGKVGVGWLGAKRIGASTKGRLRAGTALIARGEFSIVIASLGIGLAESNELGPVAAAYVLMTAIAGPIITKHSDRLTGTRARPGPSNPAVTAPAG
jgi:CPA2 family monovalent cation:H+ antiporter-2